MNCKYMNMLRVVRGNAFKLKIAVEAYTPSGRRIDSFALGEAVLKLDKNGTLTTKDYTILEGTTILVAFDGSESLGVYGFQMSGEYEGEAWRWANAEIFQIVETNAKANIPDGCVLLDDTYNMAMKIVLSGGDGVTFTPSVSEQGIISWTNDGGLPNPEPRNIRGPRGEQGPQGEVGPQGPRGQMGLRGQIGPKGDKGDKGDTGATPVLDVTASVDENVGNPMVVVESFGPAEHRTFDFQFKNLKGQKGETGATGPQGPQGQQGEPGNYTKPASGIPLSDLNGNVASGIVYDVTANNSGATFASLSALLSSGSLSTLIPTDVRKGGMQIRFVQSSDNNYVQYMYKVTDAATTATFTNVANWEKVNLEDKVVALEKQFQVELDDKYEVSESVNSGRLSKGIALPFRGECTVKISVVSGTDTGKWRLYRNINGSIGASLSDLANFGESVDVEVPNTDSGIWIFTQDNTIASARTYKIEFTNIASGVSCQVKEVNAELTQFKQDTNNEIKRVDLSYSQVFIQSQKAVIYSTDRSNTFSVSPGMKLRFGVFMVSGEGTQYTVYHTSVSSANKIFNAINVGVITDEYIVPSGVDTIVIFVANYGAGITYQFNVYNSLNNRWYTDKLNTANAYNFLKNYTPTIIEATLEVSSSTQYILPVVSNPDSIVNKDGDIYVFINNIAAKPKDEAYIRFSATDNSTFDIPFSRITLLPLKVFSGKKLKAIYVFGDSIDTAGNISLSVYCVPQSIVDMSRPLKGKTISCFGDSITEFKALFDNKRYSDWLSLISEANTLNFGIGGTRLAQRTTPSLSPTENQQCVAAFEICNLIVAWATDDFSYQDAAVNSGLLTKAQQTLYSTKLALLKSNSIENTDIVTIFGGTNDYTGGSTIGTASQSNTDRGTVYGAINAMVSALLTAKPTLKIYFFSPIIRMFKSTVSIATSSDVFVYSTAPDGKTLPQFCEVIADAVKINHCPFCDWYWSLGWNVYNFTEYFGNDYTHPYLGFWYLADKIYKFLLSK